MAKPVFSIALIYGHWKINPLRLGLAIMDSEERAKQLLKKYDGVALNEQGNDRSGQYGATSQAGGRGSHGYIADRERGTDAEVS
jgi:hypothetical protein